ncbi:IclR family transcriptional regulator [Burkholderia anthina]|uniref:IclR family transcriptional regulator n=1 Tax=Burkholderia anthina TaxID=179879 RepID=UPI001CF3E9D8|nr:IclR family transcriptional regulator [Burkholderia anthina]MCA8093788.1 IclR family transcriptional regulator [Burkholderia anthina]
MAVDGATTLHRTQMAAARCNAPCPAKETEPLKKTTSPKTDHDTENEKRSGTIQSVSIAARFLMVLANAESELALGEVARRTGTGGSTAHRYLQSLVKEGLARQDPASGLYDLGSAALSIGIGALKRVDAVEIAAQYMKSLTHRHALSGGVAIWTDRGPTLVRWYRSAYFSINPLALGDILPIDNTACGLVFQAFLPKATIDAARRQQPARFRGKPPTKAVLDAVRERCWAELTSHLLSNVTGQAAPVFDAQHEIVCAVTTVTDLGQLKSPEDRDALFREASLINQDTGGKAFASPQAPLVS